MKKSYKIGLVAAGLLCAVIIGYYVFQEPDQSRARSPIVADASRSAARTTPTSMMRPSLVTSAPRSLAAAPATPAAPPPASETAVAAPSSIPVAGPWSPGSALAGSSTLPGSTTIGSPSQAPAPAPNSSLRPSPFAPATQPAARPQSNVITQAPTTRPAVPSAGQRTAFGPVTATPAAPARTYTIKANDTFASIAVAIYGSPDYTDDIAQANSLVDPRKLKIGQVIRLPGPQLTEQPRPAANAATAATAANAANAANQTTYVTRPSDTLWSIAVQFYGDGTQWQRIYRENRERIGPDPDRLEEGLKLSIPPKEVAPSR